MSKQSFENPIDQLMQVVESGKGTVQIKGRPPIEVFCANTDLELTQQIEKLKSRGIIPTTTGHTLTWKEPTQPPTTES